jgi:glucose-6-phosphate dehydrogenase assembly protein OpcA
MTTTPLVTLQRPKDISLDEIEAELNNIWVSQNGDQSAPVATRATTFSMVVYEPDEYQQLLAALGFYSGPIDGIHGPLTKAAIEAAQTAYDLLPTGSIDPTTLFRLRQELAKHPERTRFANPDFRGLSISEAIAVQNPCRVITLCPTLGEDTGVTAQVSAYCPVQKSSSNLICCEYITLRGTKSALERVTDVVLSLMIPDLPRFVWWKATPNVEQPLFRRLAESCHCVVFDSSYFSDPEAELVKMNNLVESGTYIADLNWHRILPWQELTAAAFDPPERRASLSEIDRISIDYEKGNAAQAWMFLGWIASRLKWDPFAYEEVGGDYDLKKIRLRGPNQREIEAELAAIPTADWGEVSGDLVGLRLTSTNPQADCCTILCSETSGCMRMEAGGSAQNCRTEQVVALSDQKAEFLLSHQLQRWGHDVLYEESLAVAIQSLKLRS